MFSERLEDTETRLAKTEDWFVDKGIPHFIAEFSATEDVWTRAIGFLFVLFFSELFLTFGSGLDGWHQAFAFFLGLSLLLFSVGISNLLRGRRLLQRPRTIGSVELLLFVGVPPALAFLGGHDQFSEFLLVLVLNVLLLALVYVVVSWGIIPMVLWGVKNMLQHLSGFATLFARMMPLMLLFSAFLFINADLWQVAKDFPLSLFLVISGSLFALGCVFLFASLQGSIRELRLFSSWDEVREELDNTPMEGVDLGVRDNKTLYVPLGKAAKVNLRLRLLVGLVTQMMLVSFLVFLFYVLFGVLTIREETVLEWTALESLEGIWFVKFFLFGHPIVLTALHFVVAAFVATFSGLQFAVSLVTDETYKMELLTDSDDEVREALAVHAAYLAVFSR